MLYFRSAHRSVDGQINMYFRYHWKHKAIIVTTFSSLVVPEVLSMTNFGANSDDIVVTMMTLCFQWLNASR